MTRKPEMPPIESYFDLSELTELCGVIGPYGVKAISRKLIRLIAPLLNELQVLIHFPSTCILIRQPHLKACSTALGELEAAENDGEKLSKAIKSLKRSYFRFLLCLTHRACE